MCEVEIHGATDTGLQRQINEDRFGILAGKRLAVVCDGMGGHAAGEVASRAAVDTIVRLHKVSEFPPGADVAFGHPADLSSEARFLASTIRIASTRINRMAAADRSLGGMGTTVVAAIAHHGMMSICHVGDSRVYRIRRASLSQLTSDHSLLNELLASRQLRAEDAADFPNKNVITRALGVRERVRVDVREDGIAAGDIFLLCSDGLSGFVSDSQILELVTENGEDLPLIARELIGAANAAGGEDNITCVLIRVVSAEEHDEENSELRMATFPEESNAEIDAQKVVATWLDDSTDPGSESSAKEEGSDKAEAKSGKRRRFGLFVLIIAAALAGFLITFALNLGGTRDIVLGGAP